MESSKSSEQIEDLEFPIIICQYCSCGKPKVRVAFANESGHLCKNCYSHDEKSTKLVKYPPPFKSRLDETRDLVLIPSTGTFLNDYVNDTGLHIGIHARHMIWDYDHKGLKSHHMGDVRWKQCLHLNIDRTLGLSDPQLHSRWENVIDIMVSQKDEIWSIDKYHSVDNNCFDFVLRFMRTLFDSLISDDDIGEDTKDIVSKWKEFLIEKESFCKVFVIPRTREASKYMSIYRKLKANIRSLDVT